MRSSVVIKATAINYGLFCPGGKKGSSTGVLYLERIFGLSVTRRLGNVFLDISLRVFDKFKDIWDSGYEDLFGGQKGKNVNGIESKIERLHN